MTDLIARLAEKVSARRDYYERNMRHLGFVQTVEFTLEDAEACLHALKVQQAAEAYVEAYVEARKAEDAFVDEREGEGEYSDAEARNYTRLATKRMLAHSLLVAAVKGEQP